MSRKPRDTKTKWEEYWHQLKLEITTLERLQKTLDPSMFAKFVQNYSAHYVSALEHRELPMRACDYLREFLEVEKLGALEFEDYADLRREARDYSATYGVSTSASGNGNGNGGARSRRVYRFYPPIEPRIIGDVPPAAADPNEVVKRTKPERTPGDKRE
jgi:hypothetical protein